MLVTGPITDPTPLIRQLQATLPGVTADIIRMELFDAVRDFCRRSLAIRAEALETLPAGASELVIANGEGLEVIKVLKVVTSEGKEIPPSSSRPFVVDMGGPRRFYCPGEEENVVTFDGTSQEDLQLIMTCAVQPMAGVELIPASLWNKHYEAVRQGTIGRLYDQPGKSYSSQQKAAMALRRAFNMANDARVVAERANTMTDNVWRYPRQGGWV